MNLLETMELRHDYQKDASGSMPKNGIVASTFYKEVFLINESHSVEDRMKNARPIGSFVSPLSVDLRLLYSGSHRRSFLFFPLAPDADFEYQRALEVVLVKGTEYPGFIAQNEDLNKFAIGSDEDEALLNFEDHLISDFRSLSDSKEDELSQDAKDLLAVYKKLFRFNGGKKTKRD